MAEPEGIPRGSVPTVSIVAAQSNQEPGEQLLKEWLADLARSVFGIGVVRFVAGFVEDGHLAVIGNRPWPGKTDQDSLLICGPFEGASPKGAQLLLNGETQPDAPPRDLAITFLSRAFAAQRSTEQRRSETLEHLLHCVGVLLDERDALHRALADALRDADVARARVSELEELERTLRRERYETKNHIDWQFIVLLATCVFTLVGPLSATVMDHGLADEVRDTREAAVHVQVECGSTTQIGRLTITAHE